LRLSKVKPLHAKWTVKAVGDRSSKPDLIRHVWVMAGIEWSPDHEYLNFTVITDLLCLT